MKNQSREVEKKNLNKNNNKKKYEKSEIGWMEKSHKLIYSAIECR